jgi:hypothetical protein
MEKFTKRPMIHMGTVMTHNLWHSFTCTGTFDNYLNTIHGHRISGRPLRKLPTVREHINRSVRRVRSHEGDMIPAELGWFGIWGKGPNTAGLQLDEIEYLMAKSLAYDAPISLQTTFARMDAHPLTPGILEIVGVYERLRERGVVPREVRERMKKMGRDFLLVPSGQADAVPTLIEAKPMRGVAGNNALRAMVGRLGDTAIATVWHENGEAGELILATDRLAAERITGELLPHSTAEGKTIVTIGPRRTTLRFEKTTVEDARRLLFLGHAPK